MLEKRIKRIANANNARCFEQFDGQSTPMEDTEMKVSSDWKSAVATAASFLLLAVLAAGCGGDDDGAGLKDGGDGAASMDGAASVDAAKPVKDSGMDSGGNTCSGPMQTTCDESCRSIASNMNLIHFLFKMCLEPCCTKSDNKCGYSFVTGNYNCTELDQEGTLNPSCPSEKLATYDLKGCCRPDGFCGLELTSIGLGCVERSYIGPSSAGLLPSFSQISCATETNDGG